MACPNNPGGWSDFDEEESGPYYHDERYMLVKHEMFQMVEHDNDTSKRPPNHPNYHLGGIVQATSHSVCTLCTIPGEEPEDKWIVTFEEEGDGEHNGPFYGWAYWDDDFSEWFGFWCSKKEHDKLKAEIERIPPLNMGPLP